MIETTRLYIRPLTAAELEQYVLHPEQLSENLEIKLSTNPIDNELKDAIINGFLPVVNDKNKNYLFHTLWIIVEKQSNTITGGICFHDEPSKSGEVEIGYGTDEAFRNKGYMTEAIKALINWCKENYAIKSVIAETASSNFASVKLLKNCSFTQDEIKDNNLIFRYNIDKML